MDSPSGDGGWSPSGDGGGRDSPAFPKIEAPPLNPNAKPQRSRQTSTSSDPRRRTGSFIVGSGDQVCVH